MPASALTTDALALLSSIEAAPDGEHGPKLLYADCLDYDGYSPRAELIRVHHELMGLRVFSGDNKTHRLLNRETELLRLHLEWLPPCPQCDGDGKCAAGGTCDTCKGTAYAVHVWRCGFIEEVTVRSISDVLEHILARSVIRFHGPGATNPYWADIPESCEPTQYAHTLLSDPHMRAGLRRVQVTDRVPYLNAAGCYLWAKHPVPGSMISSVLPECVFSRLKGWMFDPKQNSWRMYVTLEEARTAAAVAVCQVIKEKVKT